MSVIQLHNQDCMEAMAEMKDKAFDLAIVDPPYGIGQATKKFRSGVQGRQGVNPKWNNETWVDYSLKEWDDTKPNDVYFQELARVSKNQIVWGGNFFSLPVHSGWIFWNKLNGESSFSDGELAWTSFDRALRMFSFLWHGFQRGQQVKRIHPTQKPVKLYEWLLKHYAKPGDRILDTHLGSGSIAIACYNLDYDLTGYEIDKEYFEAGKARLEDHIKQERLFSCQ